MSGASELVVVANSRQAGTAGFRRDTRRHHQDDRILAWWPELGIEPLRGMRFDRITVDGDAFRVLYERRPADVGRLTHELRAYCSHATTVWVHL